MEARRDLRPWRAGSGARGLPGPGRPDAGRHGGGAAYQAKTAGQRLSREQPCRFSGRRTGAGRRSPRREGPCCHPRVDAAALALPSIRWSRRTPCWSPTAARSYPSLRRSTLGAKPRSTQPLDGGTGSARGDLHVQTVNSRHSRCEARARTSCAPAAAACRHPLSVRQLPELVPPRRPRPPAPMITRRLPPRRRHNKMTHTDSAS